MAWSVDMATDVAEDQAEQMQSTDESNEASVGLGRADVDFSWC